MTEDKNKDNSLIIFVLGLAGLAFFAYLIMESSKKYNNQNVIDAIRHHTTKDTETLPSSQNSQNQVCQPMYQQPTDYGQLYQIQQQNIQVRKKLDEIFRQQIIQQQRINQIDEKLIQIPTPVPTIIPSPSPIPTQTSMPLEVPVRKQVTLENTNYNKMLSNNRINDPNIVRANMIRSKNSYNITQADEDMKIAKMFDML